MTKKQRLVKVQGLIRHYKKKLFLHEWDIDLKMSDKEDNNGAAAEATPNHVYKTLLITVYTCSFEGLNDINQIIVHELAHCLTQPLYLFANDILNGKLRTFNELQDRRESLTETLSKILK